MSGGDWEEGDGDGAHRLVVKLKAEVERLSDKVEACLTSIIERQGELERVTARAEAAEREREEVYGLVRAASMAWMILKRRCVAPGFENAMAVLDALAECERPKEKK